MKSHNTAKTTFFLVAGTSGYYRDESAIALADMMPTSDTMGQLFQREKTIMSPLPCRINDLLVADEDCNF